MRHDENELTDEQIDLACAVAVECLMHDARAAAQLVADYEVAVEARLETEMKDVLVQVKARLDERVPVKVEADEYCQILAERLRQAESDIDQLLELVVLLKTYAVAKVNGQAPPAVFSDSIWPQTTPLPSLPMPPPQTPSLSQT